MSGVFDYEEYRKASDPEERGRRWPLARLSLEGEGAWVRMLEGEGLYFLDSHPSSEKYRYGDIVEAGPNGKIFGMVERTFPRKYGFHHTVHRGAVAKLSAMRSIRKSWERYGSCVCGVFLSGAGKGFILTRGVVGDAEIVDALSACQDVLNVTAIYAEGPPIILYDAVKVVR